MTSKPDLQTDSDGNVLTKPVTGITTGTIAEIAVLLRLEYLQAENETESRSIQFAMTPQQALYLAEKLKTLAQRIMNPPPETRSV